MSWHYSQALVAAYSEDSSVDSEPCVPSNGTHTHGMFWSPGKTTDASTRSRSGMTFKPSTDAHGEALLMSYLADSRARTSARPEKAQESTESAAECGGTWRESSVRFSLDSCSWKTHRCLWEEEVPESQVILPRWGMLDAHGVLWERTTPAHLTNGTGSGSWPTPRACMTGAATPERLNDKNRNLEKAVAQTMWPTPCASEARQGLQIRREGKKGTQQSLSTAVIFATPQARDFRTGQQSRWENPERTRNLSDQIGGQLNPTWVEWLMGWPLGWTDCAASATDKFRQWLNSHGRL